MYCVNCGHKNEDSAVFCTECGQKLVSQEAFDRKSGNSKKKKRMFYGFLGIFAVIIILLLCLYFLGYGKKHREVKESAQKLADAFAAGDMLTINESIFGDNEFEIEEELSEVWGESVEAPKGILEDILGKVVITVKKITKNKIEYQVTAPDMKNVFKEFNMNEGDISKEELMEYIQHYVQNAGTKVTTVSLEYILVNDELIVNYQNEEFINAVTGGLLDAYKTLYSEMLEGYMEGVY